MILSITIYVETLLWWLCLVTLCRMLSAKTSIQWFLIIAEFSGIRGRLFFCFVFLWDLVLWFLSACRALCPISCPRCFLRLHYKKIILYHYISFYRLLSVTYENIWTEDSLNSFKNNWPASTHSHRNSYASSHTHNLTHCPANTPPSLHRASVLLQVQYAERHSGKSFVQLTITHYTATLDLPSFVQHTVLGLVLFPGCSSSACTFLLRKQISLMRTTSDSIMLQTGSTGPEYIYCQHFSLLLWVRSRPITPWNLLFVTLVISAKLKLCLLD